MAGFSNELFPFHDLDNDEFLLNTSTFDRYTINPVRGGNIGDTFDRNVLLHLNSTTPEFNIPLDPDDLAATRTTSSYITETEFMQKYSNSNENFSLLHFPEIVTDITKEKGYTEKPHCRLCFFVYKRTSSDDG